MRTSPASEALTRMLFLPSYPLRPTPNQTQYEQTSLVRERLTASADKTET